MNSPHPLHMPRRLVVRQKPPQPGDIFAMNILEGVKSERDVGWYFGRVVDVKTSVGGFKDFATLVYMYNYSTTSQHDDPGKLTLDRLLLPPLGVDSMFFTSGYGVYIRRDPLLPSDMLPIHCFRSPTVEPVYPFKPREEYLDEWGNKLKMMYKPCGIYSVISIPAIAHFVALASVGDLSRQFVMD
jgi:hypothetical protein